nr:uncharacterized protein LOC127313322 [Lolium perenne]
MSLAPRSSMRSMVLLLSHGKPRLSSLFSSIPTVTATPETSAPAAPADQPPPVLVPGSGSSCHSSVAPQKRALHRVPKTPFGTPENEVCEDPDLGVAKGGPLISSKDEPKHPTPEPALAPNLQEDHEHSIPGDSCSTFEPLPNQLTKDDDLPAAGGPSPRISSRDKPPHHVVEPTGRTRIGTATRPTSEEY